MNSFKILVAAALLTDPSIQKDLADPLTLQQEIGPTLQYLAIEWEILDPRETQHILSKPQEFANDVKLLQTRYQELANAPNVVESRRFPNREVIDEMLAFNRTFRQSLQLRLTFDTIQEDHVRLVLNESEQLYSLWDTVRSARCEYYFVTVRRQALRQLRDQVGPTAFYTGQLPPHVPVWRLPQKE